MRRLLAGARPTAAALAVRAVPAYSARSLLLCGGAGVTLQQPCRAYFTATPTCAKWTQNVFGGGDAAQPGGTGAGEGAVATGKEDSVAALLKNIANDKDSPLAFLAKLMKAVMNRLRERQSHEMQSVVEETSGILASMRTKLQALLEKVKAAEDLLQKKFPAGGNAKQPQLEDVENLLKEDKASDSAAKK